jgi:hypothetical protein
MRASCEGRSENRTLQKPGNELSDLGKLDGAEGPTLHKLKAKKNQEKLGDLKSPTQTASRPRENTPGAGRPTLLGAAELTKEHGGRVVEFVDDTFLERDDGVVGDVDLFGADFGAAFGDVAVADAHFVFQQGHAGDAVEGMHFEAGGTDEETRAAEGFVFTVITENVADVLAEKTFDAFAKFLDAINVALIHFPFDAGLRFEGGDLFVDLVIPGNVGDEIFDYGEGFERRDDDRLIERERVHTCFAGEARATVHFGRAGATFGRFAIPAYGEIGRLMGLDGMERIENDHAGSERDFVIDGLAAGFVTAEDAKYCVGHVFSLIRNRRARR